MAKSKIKNYERYIKYRDIKLHLDIVDSNSKINIIFVDGLGSYAMPYREFYTRLAQKGYNIFGLDLQGHGKSGGDRCIYSGFDELKENITTVIKYIRKNYKGKIGYIGTSFGGFLGFYSITKGIDIDFAILHGVATRRDIIKTFVKSYYLGKVILSIGSIFVKLFPKARIDLTKFLRARLVGTKEDAQALYNVLQDKYSEKLYPIKSLINAFSSDIDSLEIDMPLLIITGELDKICRKDISSKIAKKLISPYTKLNIIKEYGHSIFLIAIDRVVEEIHRFIQEIKKKRLI